MQVLFALLNRGYHPTFPDHCVSIPGFNLFRKDRIGSSGGGVSVYIWIIKFLVTI